MEENSYESVEGQFYSAEDPDRIRQLARSADELSAPTATALHDLVRWADQNESRLIVILGGLADPLDPICLSMTRRCDELGIESMFFGSVQDSLRLPSDGHLNTRGNELLAELVAERLIDGYQTDDPQVMASRHLVKAKRALASNDYKVAAREIEYSKHLLPADPRAVVLESQLQLAVDNTADAVGILNEYLESSPTNVHVLQALFDLHCSRQMPHAARLPLQRAYNLQPTNLQILSLLIQLELEAENATALSHYLHALLQLDPKNAEAKEMLAQPMFVRDQIHQTDDTSTTGL